MLLLRKCADDNFEYFDLLIFCLNIPQVIFSGHSSLPESKIENMLFVNFKSVLIYFYILCIRYCCKKYDEPCRHTRQMLSILPFYFHDWKMINYRWV